MPGNLISITPEDIASWPTPNYVDPMERNWMPIYASILYAMGTLMVVTRLGLRARNKAGGLGLDDVCRVNLPAGANSWIDRLTPTGFSCRGVARRYDVCH